ncbi:hypothetical protein S40285_07191 [Stachybotrys chlorohalonatus IBT 40285]|uniref:Uncharacterized protein n=1 Tax=Stachybotrys chlorohalonatus (strain IBT 40285) TaxID=1283841 RepID=A0A084QPV7_STAC4|nr:hypothetical protein S40285_07191 [Stachybotrys chlorohalonata IBT 40285]
MPTSRTSAALDPPVQGWQPSSGVHDQGPPRTDASSQLHAAGGDSLEPSVPSMAGQTGPSNHRRSSSEHALSFDFGSPTKQRSPLRQSISYVEATDPRPHHDSDASGKALPPLPSLSTTSLGERMSLASPSASPRATWSSQTNSPVHETSEMHSYTSEMTPRIRRLPSQPSTPQPIASSPARSRFSFFTSPMSAFKSQPSSPVAVSPDDELFNLNIESALFPCGLPSDKDTFSPAAFKNLQINATGLLRRYQTEYQNRTISLMESKAEGQAQLGEKSELETRAHQLKRQLEEMARKAAEQEMVMQELMEELNREKKLRAEEQLSRERNPTLSEGSTFSEDLGVEDDQRLKWRKSGETSKSDFSFDTDGDSVEEASLFSRSRSPTAATSSSEAGQAEPSSTYSKPAALGPSRAPRHSQTPMTTLQKLFKGVSADAPRDDITRSVGGCRNCQGQDASMAWDTVSLLRDENRGLKERVAELETAVEGALDAVIGIGINV